MEKGVKQGKSSYPLLSMKKDQANKTNVERVYRWQPLAWELGLRGSGIDLWLVQEWAQNSCTSCTSTHQSWRRAEDTHATTQHPLLNKTPTNAGPAWTPSPCQGQPSRSRVQFVESALIVTNAH